MASPLIARLKPHATLESAAFAFAWVAGLVLCALPLVNTIGPESALALSVLLAPWGAAIGARYAVRARTRRIASSTLMSKAVGIGWLTLLISLALVTLNAVRVKTCEPFAGLAFIALGPFLSVSFAALVGVAIGTVVARPRLAITLAVLVPFVAIGSALYDFVNTPGVYAFGHFFGYFPGTFYDRRIDIPRAWLTHRALTGILAAGLWSFVLAARHTRTGRLSLPRIARHPVLASYVLAAAVVACLFSAYSLELGHKTSRAHVEHKLGLAIEGPHCRTLVPRELPVPEAQRIAEDCEFRVQQLESRLGVRETERITAFFFRSAQEKRALMGAARVYIAKPWRREVYLQLAEYPHPVLPHELAHVVARHAAEGPFGVPGRLFGLVPEPTLVEGMAVALEPRARDELTPHQWAKAAYEAGVAPQLSSLLGASFFGTNQHLAYTLAGSFLGYVLETRGNETLRRVYRSARVERALNKPFAELEKEWRAWLEGVPLPERAAALARQRFERPGVFSQVCPHAVERLSQELAAALSAGDLKKAAEKCRDVLDIDPNDTGTRAVLVGTLARKGERAAADAELQELIEPPRAPSPTIARARLSLADAALMRGDFTSAEQAYRTLLKEPLSDAELRQLEVRLLGTEAGDPTRRLLGELLIGRVGRDNDPRTAMHLIRELYPLRADGLAHYLEARQLLNAGRHDLAYRLVREAQGRGLPTRRLEVEALNMRALCAYVVGALDDARETAERLLSLKDASQAEQGDARDFIARVAYRQQALKTRISP